MSKRIDLVTDFNGLIVVWVDDRVLLSDDESKHIADSEWGRKHKVTDADLVSINTVWADAVSRNAAEELIETISQNFASAAIALKGVCKELNCNLSLVDFRTAHQECFGQQNTLFLLDLQNLTQPLGFMFVNGAYIDSDWDWELYGAHCVKHYDLAKSRYRFLSRFRSDKADAVSGLLPNVFQDYEAVERWSLRHDLPAPLATHFRTFLQKYLIHDDPQVTDVLLWFVDLPLTADAAANHKSLGGGEALAEIRKRLGNNFNPESAKSLFQGGDQWSCKPAPEYAISVSDLNATCEALKLSVTLDGISADEAVRLPCQPGLPFLLSLKALIHEMNDDPEYLPPKHISMTRTDTADGKHQYTLTLALHDEGKQNQAVSIADFKKSFTSWKDRGRREETEHFTQQRLGDLEFCKIPLRNGGIIGPMAAVVAQTTAPAISVDFEQAPPSIKILWKVNKP